MTLETFPQHIIDFALGKAKQKAYNALIISLIILITVIDVSLIFSYPIKEIITLVITFTYCFIIGILWIISKKRSIKVRIDDSSKMRPYKNYISFIKNI